jgi:integrase
MSGSGKIRARLILTPRDIKGLKPDVEPYCVKDLRAVGLLLRVAPSGEKTWPLSYRISGLNKVVHTSLGRYGDPGASLEEARARANKLTAAARQRRDLIAEEEAARDAKARAMTLGALKDSYLKRRVVGRLRSSANVERILRRVLEPLASMPANDVKKRDLAPLLGEIAACGHIRAAGHAKTLIGGLFKWALSEDLVDVDPTRGLPAYDQGTPRDRVLTPDEIRSFWFWVETFAPAVRDALRFQLSTGCRVGEAGGLVIAEIDTSKWLWTLPAARSKNKKPRVTPLIGVARTIIEERIKNADDSVLFPSESGAAHTAATIGGVLYWRRSRLPIEEVVRSHDLRRTAVSLMFELGIAKDTIGAIIGHGADDDRGARTLLRHYKKTDQIVLKTCALEKYDAHLKAIISGQVPVDNVVPLRA